MAGNRFSRHFTVAEADGWIPRLRELLAVIREALEGVRDEVELLQKQSERIGGNGGGIDAPRYFSVDSAVDAALSEIQDASIVIQDLGRGLVDFPHALEDGQEVFLCWELEDGDRVLWYHQIEDGFAGRQRLSR